jgi:hypothetical protein
MRSHSLNLLTANCLQQRFAIAPLQLPQTSFFNEPQRHRGHREREIAPLNLPNSDRTPQLPKSDRTPSLPKQRSHPSTSQTAIPTERFAIALPQLPKSDRTPSTSQKRSHPLNLPNSDRTPSTSQKRSHPLNFPKQRSHPFNFPNILF